MTKTLIQHTPMLPASRLMKIVVEPSATRKSTTALSFTCGGKPQQEQNGHKHVPAIGKHVMLQRRKQTFVLWQIALGQVIKSHLQCDVRHRSYKSRAKTFVKACKPFFSHGPTTHSCKVKQSESPQEAGQCSRRLKAYRRVQSIIPLYRPP